MAPEPRALLLVARHDDADDLGEAVAGGVARLGHAVVGVQQQRDQRRVDVLWEPFTNDVSSDGGGGGAVG